MKKYSFSVLIEKDEEGIYLASVPALVDCHTHASTLEELTAQIREAIEFCLEEEDEDIPQYEYVSVQQVEVLI